MPRIFSGIQPTGNLHLGNYVGAIRRWVRLQQDYECMYCVVDLHAITATHQPDQLRAHTLEVTAALLAAGIDPKKHVVFNQSRVAAHSELAWILNCVARVGWLNRMTQFKEKAGKQRENVSVGLYTYPILMAADILLYLATHVPVGEDQKQHVELARDIAHKFNTDFAPDFFPLPEPMITGPATRVMSLRDATKKMSKSDPTDYSRIDITDDADVIRAKVRKAKTDSEPVPGREHLLESGEIDPNVAATRPEVVNLLSIFAALTDRSLGSVLGEFGGTSFSSFKETLTDAIVSEMAPIASEMRRLLRDSQAVDSVLANGAERATALAAPTLRQVKEHVGLLSRSTEPLALA